MKVINEKQILKRIKRNLGHPMVNIEMRDEDILEIIKDNIDGNIEIMLENLFISSLKETKECLYQIRGKFDYGKFIGGGKLNPKVLKEE